MTHSLLNAHCRIIFKIGNIPYSSDQYMELVLNDLIFKQQADAL